VVKCNYTGHNKEKVINYKYKRELRKNIDIIFRIYYDKGKYGSDTISKEIFLEQN
jgi:hypothetical protein